MSRTVLALLISNLAMTLCPVSSQADGVLAVGLPAGNPRNGFAYGMTVDRTADEAASKALTDCKGVDVRDTSKARAACKVIDRFRDECGNVALNGDRNTVSTAVGWGFGPDRETANKRAQTMCETLRGGNGRPCHLDGDELCDGTAK